MRTGWFICPVAEEIGADGVRRRRPKVANLRDPGAPLVDEIDPATEQPTGRRVNAKYSYTAAISDGLPGQDNDWCLVQVKGFDLSAVRADPDCVDLLEKDYEEETERASTLNLRLEFAIAAQARSRLQGKLQARGIDAQRVNAQTTVKQMLREAAVRWNPHFDADREKC